MLISSYVKCVMLMDKFKNNQQGVTAIEYAIIGVAISGIVFTVFGKGDATSGLGKALNDAIVKITGNINKV